MSVTLKTKRGTNSAVNTYTAKIGEVVTDTDNNEIRIGDEFLPGGLKFLVGDRSGVGNNEYYGTNAAGIRGFHPVPEFVDVDASEMTLNGCTLGSHFSTVIQSVDFPDASDTDAIFVFRIPKFWDLSSKLKIKISYHLDGDSTEGHQVKLDTTVWGLEEGGNVSSPTSLGTYNDYVRCIPNDNYQKIDFAMLANTEIDLSGLSGSYAENYVIVKILRDGDGVNDDYTGTFSLINAYIFEPTYGQEYGYYVAGAQDDETAAAAALVSTVRRMSFPWNNAGQITSVGNLSGSRSGMGSFNSSTGAYIVGGGDWEYGTGKTGTVNFVVSTIDRISFPFDSGTSSDVGSISANLMCVAGCNSSTHGYTFGGLDVNTWGKINLEKTYLQLESAANSIRVGNLSFSRGQCGAFNSSTHGYCCGGSNGYTTPDVIYSSYVRSQIDRIVFPFDEGTSTQVGTLGMTNNSGEVTGTYDAATCNSSDHGFIMAGFRLSSVTRVAFPFDSGSSTDTTGVLASSRSQNTGCNSSIYGYSMGGIQKSYMTQIEQIQRIEFPFASGTATDTGYIGANTVGHCKATSPDGTDFSTMF